MFRNQDSRGRAGRGRRARGGVRRTANAPRVGASDNTAPHDSVTSELRVMRRILEVNVQQSEFRKSCAEHASSCVKELRTLSFRVESMEKEMAELRRALLERSMETTAPPAVHGLDRNRAIQVYTACCSYIRFLMSAALLGKERAWFVFPSWEHSKILVEESVRFALGGSAPEKEVQDFLELYTVFGGSGIKELVPPERVTTKKKLSTVRDSLMNQRSRVHEGTVSNGMINAFMRHAPGFSDYKPGESNRRQPASVFRFAKQLLEKEKRTKAQLLLDEKEYGVAYINACREVQEQAGRVMEKALNSLRDIVPKNVVQKLTESATTCDRELGYINRSLFDFAENDGYTPGVAAIVAIKVRARVEDLASAGNKQGIKDMGHWSCWARKTMEIDTLLASHFGSQSPVPAEDAGSGSIIGTKRRFSDSMNVITRDDESDCPAVVFGVSIRCALSEEERDIFTSFGYTNCDLVPDHSMRLFSKNDEDVVLDDEEDYMEEE